MSRGGPRSRVWWSASDMARISNITYDLQRITKYTKMKIKLNKSLCHCPYLITYFHITDHPELSGLRTSTTVLSLGLQVLWVRDSGDPWLSGSGPMQPQIGGQAFTFWCSSGLPGTLEATELVGYQVEGASSFADPASLLCCFGYG